MNLYIETSEKALGHIDFAIKAPSASFVATTTTTTTTHYGRLLVV